jgi:hypothetical protein
LLAPQKAIDRIPAVVVRADGTVVTNLREADLDGC